MNKPHRSIILRESALARDRAEALLRELRSARAELDGRCASGRGQDAMRLVTGRSSLDTAIESAERMIESLDHSITLAGIRVDAGVRSRHRAAHDDSDGLRVETVRAALAGLQSARPVPSA